MNRLWSHGPSVGGAIVPALMGLVSDARGIQAALWLPAICYIVVLHFAVRGHIPEKRAAT